MRFAQLPQASAAAQPAAGWHGPEARCQFQHGVILRQLEMLGIPYVLLDGSVAERVAQVRAVLG